MHMWMVVVMMKVVVVMAMIMLVVVMVVEIVLRRLQLYCNIPNVLLLRFRFNLSDRLRMVVLGDSRSKWVRLRL